ncbi:MAG: HNH endonuclease [Leptolyngbyaceae cyanobacterium SL_7_1]|nr:HNH endonuclease [Leptolyngbyaceae cyanobacterium SL_7_1]
MSAYIPIDLRTQIERADRGRCCYCLTQAVNSGIPLSFDHILPRSKGGMTVFENVCLACRPCNEFKSDQIEATDPLARETVLLFNPRQQHWADHFEWSADGTRVEGLTPTGRVTVLALQMNHATIVVARRRWVSSGWHPPVD